MPAASKDGAPASASSTEARKPVIVAGDGAVPARPPAIKPTFGTVSPGISFKNIVAQHTPAPGAPKKEEARKIMPEVSAPGPGQSLKFGSFNASLPLRVQSAPPTLEEQEVASREPVQRSSATALEPTPEGTVAHFPNATTSVPSAPLEPGATQIPAPTPAAVRPFVPTGEATPFYPQGPAYYGNGMNYAQMYSQHNYYAAPRGGYGGHYAPSQNYYSGYYHHQAPYRPYIPHQGHQHPQGVSLPVVPHDSPSRSNVVPSETVQSAPVPPVVTPAPRQGKKIAIVDPNTGQELDIASIAKAKSAEPKQAPAPAAESRPIETTSTAEVQPIEASPTASPKETAAVTLPASSPRKPVVLVDPRSNEPVDIAELAAAAKREFGKINELLGDFDDDDAFSAASGFSSDEEVSEGEDEDEEEEIPADIEFPVILTRAIKVAYPEGAIGFKYPPEGEPLRYSTEFLLQFAPHCHGSAQDIASIAFPKDIPVVRVSKKSGRSGSSRHHRTGSSRHQHYTAEQLTLTNRAQDAWKRACAEVLPADLVALREVKQILNKLTEDKFETLTKQILALGILNPGVMSGVIDMLFDKAVEEPRYAPLYARLCHRIALHEIEEKKRLLSPEEFAQTGNHSQFRKILVGKCEHEYNAKRAYSSARLARIRAQEAADSGDAAVVAAAAAAEQAKPQYTGELTEEDYAMIKTKRRVLGNMRFIGEIFMVGLIPAKIMHAVIQELLTDVNNPEEEEVESVCRLLPTIGAALDIPESAALWEKYAERLRRLSVNPKLPTRVRFMVLDVLELRENKWSKPKLAASQPPSQQRRNSERERDRDQRRDSGDARIAGDVRAERRPSARSQNSSFERSGTAVRIQIKAKGEEIVRPASTASRASQDSINRYHALEEENGCPSRGSDGVVPTLLVTPSDDVSSGLLADEKVLSKLNGVFEEAQTQKNFADCVAIIREMAPAARCAAVRSIVLYAMDKNRKHVNSLIADVIPLVVAEDGLLSSATVITGLREAFELLDDLVVDIPSAYEFAGYIAAAFIDAKLVSLCELIENILATVLERDSLPVAKCVLYALKGMAVDATAKRSLVEESRVALEKCLFQPGNKATLESLVAKLGLSNVVQL